MAHQNFENEGKTVENKAFIQPIFSFLENLQRLPSIKRRVFVGLIYPVHIIIVLSKPAYNQGSLAVYQCLRLNLVAASADAAAHEFAASGGRTANEKNGRDAHHRIDRLLKIVAGLASLIIRPVSLP